MLVKSKTGSMWNRPTNPQPEQLRRRRRPLPPRMPPTPKRRPPAQNPPHRSGAASPYIRQRAMSPAATTSPMNDGARRQQASRQPAGDTDDQIGDPKGEARPRRPPQGVDGGVESPKR